MAQDIKLIADDYLPSSSADSYPYNHLDLSVNTNTRLNALDQVHFPTNIFKTLFQSTKITTGSQFGPDPKQVGFHNLALIYDTYDTSIDALEYYFGAKYHGNAYVDYSHKMFDAFLPVTFYINGKQTDYGATTKKDWQDYLTKLFAKDGIVDHLNQVAGESGQDRKLVVMMPWLNPSVKAWDTNVDLSTGNGRQQAAGWYISQVIQLMKNYPHLQLWGLYRMREDITSAENGLIVNENEAIHQAGYRSLFIPYWNAPGEDDDNGFDCRILQPSYAFHSVLDGGLVDKDRLYNAFNHTAGAHEGMEMEFRGQCDLLGEKYIVRKYLEYGAQMKVTAAFLGSGLDKFDKDVYDAVVKWLDGYNVNSQEDWITNTGKGEATIYQYPVPHTLFLQRDNDVQADQSVIANVDHRPVSWAAIAGSDSMQQLGQAYYLPLPDGLTATENVDLKLFQYNKKIPLATMLVGYDDLPNFVHNDLIGSHIEVTNQAVDTTNYYDVQYTGVIKSGKLNDGKISQQWSDGGVDGWNSNPGRAVISFDFGSAKMIAGFRVYCNQDNQAGIQYPLNPVMLMTSKPRITVTSALGSVSPVINAVGLYPSDLTQNGGTAYQGSGYYAKTGLDVTTRYASLLFSTNGWAMISEIEFYDDQGQKIPFSYELLRHTGNQSLYQDDGLRLADGQYIDGYASGGITALNNNLTNRITMTHDPVLLNQIDIYSMEDPRYQLAIPKQLEVWIHTPGGQLLQLPKPSMSRFGRYGIKLTTKFNETNVDQVIIKDYGDGNWHAFTEIAGNDTKHE